MFWFWYLGLNVSPSHPLNRTDVSHESYHNAQPHWRKLAAPQAIVIFEPSAHFRAAEMAAVRGATNTGPLSGVVADWGGAWNALPGRSQGDAPKAGQLQGDRTSLFLSN